MSTIWPFFNSSFSNANINKILTEIEQDNTKRISHAAAINSTLALTESIIGADSQTVLSSKEDVATDCSKSQNSPSAPSTSSSNNTCTTLKTPTAMPISLPTTLLNNNTTSAISPASSNSPIDSSMSVASLSPHVAYSPTANNNQFNITASQLLHSIQNNSPSPSPSPLATKVTNNTSNNNITSSNTNASKNDILAGQTNPKSINKPSAKQNSDLLAPSSVKSKHSTHSSVLNRSNEFPKSAINVVLFNKLLDQPNLIEEINLSKNQKLINYLSQKDVIDTMFEYILFSLKLSKFSTFESLPSEYMSHDIFILDHSDSRCNSDNENDNDNDNDNFSDNGYGSHINLENDKSNKDESSENIDKLQLALQRATILSEITITPNANIHQTLLSHFDIFTKVWKGFMNNDPRFYFRNVKFTEPHFDPVSDIAKENNEQEKLDADSNIDDIVINTTDSQKLSELEESNNYMDLRDSHEIILFNNFLKFVDDLATINISGFMNFVRFEQEFNLFTDQFLKFIPYSQTICDLLVRLISTDKPYNSNGLINILLDQDLVPNLLGLCKKYHLDHQVQDNLCNLLNGIVGISSNIGFWEDQAPVSNINNDEQAANNSNNPNIGPNDLTRQLVSQTCIEQMLEIILKCGNYGLVTIISVIIEIIRKNNSDYDEFDWVSSVNFNQSNKSMPSSRDPIYLGDLLKMFSINLDKIVETYLTTAYYKFKNVDSLSSSIGHKIEPLGYERFKIMELIAELLHCSNMILMNKSIELDKLIYKRDLLRDATKTEQLMSDAINGLLVSEDDDMENDSETSMSVKSVNSNLPYIEVAHGLSIGNFFKYKLLVTHAVPLITMKLIKFPWNNFMHNVIFDLIQQIFNGRLANWDEDRAINQEETIFDDNLSLNKILIWSLFGEYEDFDNPEDQDDLTFYKDFQCKDTRYPGYFNLALFILHCYRASNKLYLKSNFRFGYMGHLTLIAEEITKFQSYVENFGLTKNENAFGLNKEEEDPIRPFYLKSSYYIFNELYESIFEHRGNFHAWLEFSTNELREISSMYNKVLGNPNEIDNDMEDENNTSFETEESPHLGLTTNEVIANMTIEETPKAPGAILLDNGDNADFRQPLKSEFSNKTADLENEDVDVDTEK